MHDEKREVVSPEASAEISLLKSRSEDVQEFATLDVRSVVAAIQRNITWVAAIVVGCMAIGIVVTLLSVPQYIATSTVLIEQEAEKIIEETTSSASAYQDADRFLRTQADIIGSQALAIRVVESEGLAADPRFFEALGGEYPTEEDVDSEFLGPEGLIGFRRRLATSLLLENLEVELPAQSRLIDVSVQSADPIISASLANAVAENYLESNLARKFDSSAYAREFLSQQLADARAKLEQSERDLNQYSRSAGLIRVTGQGDNADQETTLSVTNDSLVQTNAAANSASADRIIAENRWLNIRDISVMSVPQVLANQAVQQLLAEKAEIQAELAEERVRHLDDHPNVKALQAQLDDVVRQIEAVGNSIKRSVKLEYQSARDRELAIQQEVARIRKEALNEQDRGVQYNLLKRVAETDRALYNTLLTRFNELSATAGAASNNVSIVDIAEVPREPYWPKPLLNILLALILGIGLSVLFVAVREILDDVVRSPDDVERKLGLPLLGLIPQSERHDIEEDLVDQKSAVSESYQSLVANLRYSSPDGIPKSILVTSSQQGEGKSTSAHQLAREFARLDRRTLLIDADLRRPTLHRRMAESQPVEGLTALLAGAKAFDEVVVSSSFPNLDYLTALPIPVAPSALIAAADWAQLIGSLCRQYDHVVIDAPPVLGFSDAPTLAAIINSTVLIVDAGKARGGNVNAAMRRLELVNAHIIGAVLTKFNAQQAGSAYSYYGTGYYTYEHSSED